MKTEWEKPSDEMSRDFYNRKKNFYLEGLMLGAFIALIFVLLLVVCGHLTGEEYLKKKSKEVMDNSEFAAYSGDSEVTVVMSSPDGEQKIFKISPDESNLSILTINSTDAAQSNILTSNPTDAAQSDILTINPTDAAQSSILNSNPITIGSLSKTQKQELADLIKKQYKGDAFVDSLEVYILAFLLVLAWVSWLLYRMKNLSMYKRKAFGYLRGTVVDKNAEKMLMDKYRMNYYVTLELDGVGGEFTAQTSSEDFYSSKMGTAFYVTHFTTSDDADSVDWAFICE